MENISALAFKIKSIRERNNLSQDRFGKKIGLTGKTISAYETGRSTPPLKVLEKIADAYNTPFIKIKNSQKDQLLEKLQLLESELISLKDILSRGLE